MSDDAGKMELQIFADRQSANTQRDFAAQLQSLTLQRDIKDKKMRAVMIALLSLAAVQVRLNYEGALIGGKLIPDICHLHHMQCRCQIFQPGVKISRINAFLMFFGIRNPDLA